MLLSHQYLHYQQTVSKLESRQLNICLSKISSFSSLQREHVQLTNALPAVLTRCCVTSSARSNLYIIYKLFMYISPGHCNELL